MPLVIQNDKIGMNLWNFLKITRNRVERKGYFHLYIVTGKEHKLMGIITVNKKTIFTRTDLKKRYE